MSMVKTGKQLLLCLLVSALVRAYAPHFTTIDGLRFNMYSVGQVRTFGARVKTHPPTLVGEATVVDVRVSNSGDTDANDVVVSLSYTDWGVAFERWFEIGNQVVNVPAGGEVIVSFEPVFENRAQVSLEAVASPPGGRAGEVEARGATGYEALTCDEDCSVSVPMRNNGESTITLDNVQVLCLPTDEEEGDTVELPLSAVPGPCPEHLGIELQGRPTTLPPYSETLVKVGNVTLDEGESVRLVVHARNADTGEVNSVLVDLVRGRVSRLLNFPALCCLRRVKVRALLGRVLADALEAYEDEDPGTAIALLRFFMARALRLAEQTSSRTEKACLERAVRIAANAARIIAFGSAASGPAAVSALAEADFLRRAGQHDASALYYARPAPFKRKHFKGMLTQWPATY